MGFNFTMLSGGFKSFRERSGLPVILLVLK